MEYKNIIVKREDKIAVITINREKALNALNDETVNELQSFFHHSWGDNSLGCVIITGAGKAFVAGADISELAQCDVQKAIATSMKGLYLTKTIENFPCPVIAAVNGFALGGGCELAMACDIRLASDKAKFGQPEVNLGLIPGYGGTQRLARLVGRGKAKQMIFTGEMIDAHEAHRIGLVDEVYPVEELMNKAMEMAKSITSKASLAIAVAKECINRGLDINLSAACDLEKINFGAIYGTSDAFEGMKAFLEKRKAEFKGK
ncbi:MAG: enoyl-CoA hydratase-related protein [candidate division Zixibacteria bacterium]|nr:enoyl-CoA hydratase-related protein [candidate division Zixibacteria bacterium]